VNEVIVGLILIVLGLVVCFYGLKFFFVLLPVWGFIAGFFLGAHGVQSLLGGGFLATGASWIVGVVLGVIFAVASYFIWYIGALIAAGSVGAILGTGLMSFITSNGVLNWIAAAIGAIVIAVLAALVMLPVFMVVVNTAFAGAAAAVIGLLFVLHRLTFVEVDNGESVINSAVQHNLPWVIVWVALAVIGSLWQVRDAVNTVALPEDKWTSAQPA